MVSHVQVSDLRAAPQSQAFTLWLYTGCSMFSCLSLHVWSLNLCSKSWFLIIFPSVCKQEPNHIESDRNTVCIRDQVMFTQQAWFQTAVLWGSAYVFLAGLSNRTENTPADTTSHWTRGNKAWPACLLIIFHFQLQMFAKWQMLPLFCQYGHCLPASVALCSPALCYYISVCNMSSNWNVSINTKKSY